MAREASKSLDHFSERHQLRMRWRGSLPAGVGIAIDLLALAKPGGPDFDNLNAVNFRDAGHNSPGPIPDDELAIAAQLIN